MGNFQVMGWDAEVMDMKTGGNDQLLRIQRIRFTKVGYQPMDIAMTEVFLETASRDDVISLISDKVAKHQADQDMKRPPGPGYTFDGDPDSGFFTKEKVKITANEVGIKFTPSDLLLLDDLPDTRSRRQIMEDIAFPENMVEGDPLYWVNKDGKSARPEVLSPSEQGKVRLTTKEVHGKVKLTNKVSKTTEMLMREAMKTVSYAAIMSPMILNDLYGEVGWDNEKNPGPDAEETGEWEI